MNRKPLVTWSEWQDKPMPEQLHNAWKEQGATDKLAVGVPYQDKSNIGRYSDIDLTDAANTWLMTYETIQDKSEPNHVSKKVLCTRYIGK
jgi:hypothetical protein